MSSTLREIADVFRFAAGNYRFWGVFVAILALFILVGPFSTYERMGLVERALYWSTTMVGAWLIALVTISVVIALFVERYRRPFVLTVAGAALAGIPIAAWLSMSIAWFYPPDTTPGFPQMLVYGIPMSALFGVLVGFTLPDPVMAGHEPMDGKSKRAPDNALTDRLPPDIRAPVKRMSMQDHYIEVTTERGAALVLMRMADAATALEGHGLQIHRSHWVSFAHAKGAKREGGQWLVVMDDGAELPVSRSFQKLAKEAGLLG